MGVYIAAQVLEELLHEAQQTFLRDT